MGIPGVWESGGVLGVWESGNGNCGNGGIPGMRKSQECPILDVPNLFLIFEGLLGWAFPVFCGARHSHIFWDRHSQDFFGASIPGVFLWWTFPFFFFFE